MAKGENIFKRKDGRWEARYIKGREQSGKIRYGFCYGGTYQEAKEKVTKIKMTMARGETIPTRSARKKISVLGDEWLQANKNRIKESSYVKYCGILEKYIKPRLGGYYIQGLTNELIDEFAEELLQKDGLAPKTVKDILVTVHSMIVYGERQYPGIFPMIHINYPKMIKKEMRVLTRNEQNRLVEYLLQDMEPCKFGILLALFTGMRIGELCALRWEDISIENQIIHVNATMQRLKDVKGDSSGKTRVIIGPPKSETSVRVIPMTGLAATFCMQMQTECKAAFVLTGNEKYMEPRTLQYRLKKYTKECGLEGVHFHTLRHTFATRCVEVGFEIKTLSEILGHATTTITLDRYVHSSLEMKRTNMNKLQAAGL